MPPEARPTTSRAPSRQLSFAQKQALFEGLTKQPVDRGNSPWRPPGVVVDSRKYSLTKAKADEAFKQATPRGSSPLNTFTPADLTPSPILDSPVSLHVESPATTLLLESKSSLNLWTRGPVMDPPFEIYGVKYTISSSAPSSVEHVKAENHEFKITPIHEQDEQLCEFWLSNRGDHELVVQAPYLDSALEPVVFSTVDVSHIGSIPPQTTKMSATNKFILRCQTSLLTKTFKTFVTIPWKDAKHKTQYYRLKVYANALSDAENLQYLSIPLRYIPDKWHLVANDVVNPEFKDEIETTLGLHASLAFLNHVYCNLDHIPGWTEVKDSVEVGLLKETRDCGNSSVSMGLAWNYFKKNQKEEYVAFLNCGTAGAKLQIYTRQPSGKKNLVSIVKEDKPEGMGAVSHISVGNYRPQTNKKQPLVVVKEEIERVFLKPFMQYKRTIKQRSDSVWSQERPFAFVTGTIRNHWEKETDDMEKQEMELKMFELFSSEDGKPFADPVSALICEESGKKNQHCYFVSTEDEGCMESIGVRAMQKSVDRVLNKDASLRVDPVAVLGVGTGASRLTIMSSKTVGRFKKKQYDVISHDAGMKNTMELLKLGRVLINDERIAKLIEACLRADSRRRIPMIALKSGALSRLWNGISGLDARKALTTSPNLDYYKTKEGFDGRSHHSILSATTLSRFASDCNRFAKSEHDYLVAHKNGVRMGPGEYGEVSVEFVRTPPENDRKTNTCCYITPKDSVVWEGLPQFVWWWPWKDRKDRENDPCKSPLLIRLPFCLLKDFLPSKKRTETIIARFESLLGDFLGHEASKPAASYECICKVYRLLHEVRHSNCTNPATKAQYDEEAEQMVNRAVLFAGRPPKYDQLAKTQFKLSRVNVLEKIVDDEKIGWRTLSRENPTEWGGSNSNSPQQNPFHQEANSFGENRRRAWFLLEPFTRALQATCDSKLLSNFSGLNFVTGVKSEKGLLRKQEVDRKEAKDIYDYLRGTIYVGRGKESMTAQVLAILDAIQAHVAPLERIKWDHCDKDKGFIIVNVRFGVGAVSLLCEVQIRLPSKKSSSAPRDDHLKHEADRTFGHYFRNRGSTTPCGTPIMTFDDAVAEFFSLPCKHTFGVFKSNESVTIQEVGGEVEVLRSTPTEEVKSNVNISPTKPNSLSQQQQEQRWALAIDHFCKVLRDLTTGQGDIVTAESVVCPDYVDKSEQDNFYLGVREGFEIVLRALGDDEKEKTQAKEEKTDPKENFIMKNKKYVYDAAVITWLVRELNKIGIDSVTATSDQIQDELVQELAMCSNPLVMGMVNAWRFCCRNSFLYKMLKDESIQWLELFTMDVEKARIFGVLAAVFCVGDQVHMMYMEDQARRVEDLPPKVPRRLPSVYTIGFLGRHLAPDELNSEDIAQLKQDIKDYNDQRKGNKKGTGKVCKA